MMYFNLYNDGDDDDDDGKKMHILSNYFTLFVLLIPVLILI